MNKPRSIRNAFASTAVACALPVSAIANESASTAFDACTAETEWTEVVENLLESGWREVTLPLSAIAEGLLVDGMVAAMSVDRNTRINWGAAMAEAGRLANTLEQVASSGSATILQDQGGDSILFVTNRDDNPNWHSVHCIFGGSSGEELGRYLDTLAAMDEITGITQATDGLYIATMQSRGQTDDNPARVTAVDARYGRYTSAIPAPLNREATVELGFSVFSFVQR
jgi:hypothetical protein